MRSPQRHYSDFKTYKPTFERLRALFWLLYKLDRVPRSFYIKFTRPDPSTPAKDSHAEAIGDRAGHAEHSVLGVNRGHSRTCPVCCMPAGRGRAPC